MSDCGCSSPDPYSAEALECPPTTKALAYYEPKAPDDYAQQVCRLDVYVPEGVENYPTVVFFHGGGLEDGERNCQWGIPCRLNEAGIGCVVPGYRLSPKVNCPAYLQDAAAAVAWTLNHIAERGGDPNRVFVSGHSAGAFLASMLSLDPRWLDAHGLSADALAGSIPIAGQMITHARIRAERGLGATDIVVDDFAPLGHVRANSPPMLLVAAENDIPTRVEENRLMLAEMCEASHPDVSIYIAPDREHVTVAEFMARPGDPLLELVTEFVKSRPKR